MAPRSKGLAIASYITWIGWIIALLARDKNDTLVRHHLNQTLVLNLISTVCTILSKTNVGILQIIAGIVAIVTFVFWVWGLILAIQGSEKPLPLIGELKFIN